MTKAADSVKTSIIGPISQTLPLIGSAALGFQDFDQSTLSTGDSVYVLFYLEKNDGGAHNWEISECVYNSPAETLTRNVGADASRRSSNTNNDSITLTTTHLCSVVNPAIMVNKAYGLVGEFVADEVNLGIAALTLAGKGVGTINATGLYDNSMRVIPDYVFDLYVDGITEDDIPDKYKRLSLEEYQEYWRRERHIDTMMGRDEWGKDGATLGDLVEQLIVTVEHQATYICELNERLKALETS